MSDSVDCLLTVSIKVHFVFTDSDVVVHRPSGLHVLLCAGSLASCQIDSPHAELSSVRYF